MPFKLVVTAVILLAASSATAQDALRHNSGQPYLAPEETIKRFTLHDGFEAKVFAAEPELINPIAMCFDERGRVWVIESFEYPKGTPPGQKPRDRIKIYEDRDGDHRADKITLFADGFNLATGIAVGHGGVFVGAAPDLLFIPLDASDDKPAGPPQVLLTGFGRHDTHELLNTFTWGPDGWLYGCHGVFTHSKVKRPIVTASNAAPRSQVGEGGINTAPPLAPSAGRGVGVGGEGTSGAAATTPHPADGEREKDADEPLATEPPIEMNAAVWRYHPRSQKFEIFAEGTSNPWGIDFDNRGNMFQTCCVIPHLFHIIPGGRYIRQAGQNRNPYDFGQLKEISDHRHHEESGWAHAGCVVLDTEMWSDELRGSVIFGSIHGNSIKRDVLKSNASSFIASHAPDFLKSGDKNFRPVYQAIGPDGSIYVTDWHDQWPCHQTPPDLWDKERGRLYKIVRVGATPTPPRDMGKLTNEQLVAELRSPNPYVHRTALRLLGERRATAVVPTLQTMLRDDSASETNQVRAAWALFSIQGLDMHMLARALEHKSSSVRAAVIRMLGDQPNPTGRSVAGRPSRILDAHTETSGIERLAAEDKSAAVRLQIAATFQRLAPPRAIPVLNALAQRDEDASDPNIPLMIWFAYEPIVVEHRDQTLDWLRSSAAEHAIVRRDLVPRVMRRLVATGKSDDLAACVRFAASATAPSVRRAALDGLAAALDGRRVTAPAEWSELRGRIDRSDDAAIRMAALRLGASFRDNTVVLRAEAIALDPAAPIAERSEAVRCIATAQFPQSRHAIASLLKSDAPTELRREAIRALASFGSDETPQVVFGAWKSMPDVLKAESITLLTSRRDWSETLLHAIAENKIDRADLSAASAQRIAAINDAALTALLEKTWGSVRQKTPAEIEDLIKRMRRVVATGKGDATAGQVVFQMKCATCHKFNGPGADVGPDITGADRSVEYLLINILDPNRVVGQPYYQHVVATKSGRVVSGKLIRDAADGITLQGENNKIDVIPREEIDEHVVKNISVMPEGLPKDMTEEQFRDLIEFVRRK